MANSAKHVVCPHCGSVNRIEEGKKATGAKCGRCHLALFAGLPAAASAAAFEKHIRRNDIPVLVDFWAEWCGPCKAMAPIFAKVAKELEPDIRFLKVDTDAEPTLAARYNIRSIPTMLLFRNGAPIAHQVGAVGEQALRAWLLRHLS